MSDPALPPSSAPASLASTEHTSSRSSFAFLVHSMETLPRNLPPDVDNKSLARQKRRRTSPEDQAILEEEYRRNPKPDKAARMSIVSRVALGEKEVQIWFQNRRQSTRRKSRPLLPHELLSSQRSSFGSSSIDDHNSPGSSQEGSSLVNSSVSSSQELSGSSALPVTEASTQPTQTSTQSTVGMKDPRGATDATSQSQGDALGQGTSFTSSITWVGESKGERSSQERTRQLPPGLGYISNRRSGPFPALKSGPLLEPSPSQEPSSQEKSASDGTGASNDIPRLLKRTSSLVRLSLSLDGKAQVMTGAETSPPRSQPTRPRAASGTIGGMQRSRSMVAPGEKAQISRSSSFSQLPRPPMGPRSAGTRTWEFYCDGDARSAISAKTEPEPNGDAAGAIELLRSRNSKTLMTNKNKRNALPQKDGPTKRAKAGGAPTGKPKLVRTSSSFARLQTGSSDVKKHLAQTKQGFDKSHRQVVLGSPSGDSDKENWLPGTQQPRPHRQGQPLEKGRVRPKRPVLEEATGGQPSNSPIPKLDFKRGAAVSHERGKRAAPVIHEDGSSSDDSSGHKSGSSLDIAGIARGEEDLDCVQNLLSLSQGNWR